MPESSISKRWWITPLVISLGTVAAITYAWQSSDAAKEILAKSFFTIAGTLATPFILESSIAILGLVAVLSYNEWRREKDGPEWVEMEVPTKPSAENSQKVSPSPTHSD